MVKALEHQRYHLFYDIHVASMVLLRAEITSDAHAAATILEAWKTNGWLNPAWRPQS